MTIQELMDAMPSCDLAEIVIRKTGHGQWIQGYRVGKEAKIFPSEYTVEEWERRELRYIDRKTRYLEEGTEVDIRHGRDLPMKVICRDCHKLPEYIGQLEVCSIQPRNVPHFHGDQLTHNEFSVNVDCYLPDAPERFIECEDVTTKRIDDQIDGQMNITDFLGGTT